MLMRARLGGTVMGSSVRLLSLESWWLSAEDCTSWWRRDGKHSEEAVKSWWWQSAGANKPWRQVGRMQSAEAVVQASFTGVDAGVQSGFCNPDLTCAVSVVENGMVLKWLRLLQFMLVIC